MSLLLNIYFSREGEARSKRPGFFFVVSSIVLKKVIEVIKCIYLVFLTLIL